MLRHLKIKFKNNLNKRKSYKQKQSTKETQTSKNNGKVLFYLHNYSISNPLNVKHTEGKFKNLTIPTRIYAVTYTGVEWNDEIKLIYVN